MDVEVGVESRLRRQLTGRCAKAGKAVAACLQGCGFFSELLHPVLTKQPLAGSGSLQQEFDRMGFGDGHEPDAFTRTACLAAGRRDRILDEGQVLSDRAHAR